MLLLQILFAGVGEKPCMVAKQQCIMAKDPCRSKASEWDCLANKACQFVRKPVNSQPDAGQAAAGVCFTLPQHDVCKKLTPQQCDTNPACALADR
jgi:hypothetical protein